MLVIVRTAAYRKSPLFASPIASPEAWTDFRWASKQRTGRPWSGLTGQGRPRLSKFRHRFLPRLRFRPPSFPATTCQRSRWRPRFARLLAGCCGIYQDMRIGEFLEFFVRTAFSTEGASRTTAVERRSDRAGLCDDATISSSIFSSWKQRLRNFQDSYFTTKLLLLDGPATGLTLLPAIQLREQLSVSKPKALLSSFPRIS